MPPELEGRILTTGPLGKSLDEISMVKSES